LLVRSAPTTSNSWTDSFTVTEALHSSCELFNPLSSNATLPFVRSLHKVLDFHLFQFAAAEYKITRTDFTPGLLLPAAPSQMASLGTGIDNILGGICENPLRSLRPEIASVNTRLLQTNISLEHRMLSCLGVHQSACLTTRRAFHHS